MLKYLFDSVADLFYPRRCLVCQKIGAYLCETCYKYLPYLESPPCPVCTRQAIGGFTHPRCRGRYRIDRLIVSFKYRNPIALAIKKIKYREITDLADFLVALLAADLAEAGIALGEKSLLVPVPLHPIKEIERGYNQSTLLAKSLGKAYNLPVVPDALIRVRETVSQTKLKHDEREKNVRGAFKINPKRRELLRGQDVVLVDDVFTTGATLRECGSVLKRAGVRHLYALAIAKD